MILAADDIARLVEHMRGLGVAPRAGRRRR